MNYYNIWLTNKCVLNCKYCYEHIENSKKTNMEKHIAEKVISFIKKQDRLVERVNFHGGEPLLSYEIMEHFVKKLISINPNIKFSFTTNGAVWNRQIYDLLDTYKNNFESGITVSIDGNKKIHDLNRQYPSGEGSYDHMLKTLTELKSIFCSIRGRMTITPETVRYIYKSVVHLQQLNINIITHAFDYFNNTWTNDDIRLIKEEYEKVIMFWKQNRNVNISFADGLGLRMKKKEKCSLNINIGVDGNIYPCSYTVNNEEYIIGNVENGVLENKVENYKRNILCKDNEFCEKCSNKDYCISNRCKFLNKAITGNYYMPSGIACALENVENSLLIRYKENFINVR